MNATTNSENGLKQNIRSRRRVFASVAVGAALLGFVILCVVATVLLLRPEKPHTYRIHLTTDNTPRRIHLAEQIRAEASRHNLDVIHAAKEYGTLDALTEIDGISDVKFSLVSGGVSAGEYPNVRMVTTLAKEPLHVLVRAELADKGISGLRGKRVHLGHSSTSSYHVAREVLAFVGIRPTTEVGTSGYVIDPMTTKGGVQMIGKIATLKEPERSEAVAQLPDAAVFLAPLPSPSAMKLVKDCG